MADDSGFHAPEGLQAWLCAALADSLPRDLSSLQGAALNVTVGPTPGTSWVRLWWFPLLYGGVLHAQKALDRSWRCQWQGKLARVGTCSGSCLDKDACFGSPGYDVLDEY
ncbi:Hypothetical predicted protein [Pelobates cultripes]|uniref:Uncharacterized protein n=1 Tax=Pelobates cultripes TaxID=61616 RepID=A0AAD1VYC7_PELCU|nr:Hypothetical predicted protein [Pelobates cultripes]